MKREYTPRPIDVDAVELPSDIEELVETVAKNVHEVWAKSRIGQGWKFGPERNERLKQHPSLIPYEELSEEEKDYDRNTAKGTLKVLIKMGYKITKE